MTTETWYLAWPNRIEVVEMDFSVVPSVEEFTRRHGSRGPFPTKEMANDAIQRDDIESLWKHGLDVYANHCTGCGRWAKTVAGDDTADFWWYVTECKKCGFREFVKWRDWWLETYHLDKGKR